MTDPTPRVRAVMQGNRRRDTIPELGVRRLLHKRGLRYLVDRPIEAAGRVIRPDLVFPRSRTAVFVDGCFWHGCPEHYVPSKTNRAYWKGKIAANCNRDRWQTRALEQRGWTVVRVFSHVPAIDAASVIADAVRQAAQCSAYEPQGYRATTSGERGPGV